MINTIQETGKQMQCAVNKLGVVLPLVAALTGCGGGGSDKASPGSVDIPINPGAVLGGGSSSGGYSTSTTPGSVTGTAGSTSQLTQGKVDVPLRNGATLRVLTVGTSSQGTANVNVLDQQADGAVVRINGNTLGGTDRSVVNLAGDATWAMGRWARGNAVVDGRAITLGVARNDAYHYVVFNPATVFPTSATLTCDAGEFTAPNVVKPATGEAFGTASGKAALRFVSGIAVVNIAVTATAGIRQATVTSLGNYGLPLGSAYFFGGFDSFASGTSDDGFLVTVGDAGNGKFRLIAGYQVTSNGASYRGVAAFLCSP